MNGVTPFPESKSETLGSQKDLPPILPPIIENIPEEIRGGFWCAWEAVWNEKRGKYDKIPHNGYMRISTRKQEQWLTFDDAVEAYKNGFTQLHGVGKLVCPGEGFVITDPDGTTDPDAADEYLDTPAGYMEESPGGNGMRGVFRGEIQRDITKPIEIYAGHSARFVTITGRVLPGHGKVVDDEGALQRFIDKNAKSESNQQETAPPPGLPKLLAADDALIQRGRQCEAFAVLMDKGFSGNRSNEILGIGNHMYLDGMDDDEVLSLLYHCPHSWQMALDHRSSDANKALAFLWQHVCLKAREHRSIAHEDFSDLAARLGGDTEKPRYTLLSAAEVAAMPPIKFLVYGVLPTEGLAAIFGPAGSSKSFLTFDLVCAIAAGADWFGRKTLQAPVVYVCLEGEAGLPLRVRAWEKHHDKPVPENVHIVMREPFFLTENRHIADLAAVVPGGAVVVVDTMNRAAPTADENSSKDMGAIIEGCKALQRLTGGLVALVAHTGKDASRGLRGHSSMPAALDAAIEVARTGDCRAWSIAKAKDGADGGDHPFELVEVELGVDDDLNPLTSCAIQAGGGSPKVAAKLTQSQRTALESYSDAALTHGALDDNGAFTGLSLEHWRPWFYKHSTADRQSAKKMAFKRARDSLIELGLMRVTDDVYHLTGAPDCAGILIAITSTLRLGDALDPLAGHTEHGTAT